MRHEFQSDVTLNLHGNVQANILDRFRHQGIRPWLAAAWGCEGYLSPPSAYVCLPDLRMPIILRLKVPPQRPHPSVHPPHLSVHPPHPSVHLLILIPIIIIILILVLPRSAADPTAPTPAAAWTAASRSTSTTGGVG